MTGRARLSAALVVTTAWAAIVLPSCTGEAPRIQQIFWQLNVIRDLDAELDYEGLSLFLQVEDGDGYEDLTSLFLLRDRDELFWQIESDSWEMVEEVDEVWVGSNEIRMATGGVFPRGAYRVMIVDQAGERGREEIFISSEKIDPSQLEFPEVRLSEGVVELRSPYEEHSLWFYGADGAVLKTFTSRATQYAIASVLNTRERDLAHRFSVYAYDDVRGIGVVVGPFLF